ncbi:MAG TPA: hypothetical protein VFM01_14335 [Nakamurella sp.]|nr:hypothetical protein [Nakamurella sp.]
MTQPSRDDAVMPTWASVWSGQAGALHPWRTRSAPPPRHAGRHLAELGRRIDIDPDDQVPMLHWDQPPGIDDGPPALPILMRALDTTDRPIADRPVAGGAPVPEGPVAVAPVAGLPRQRTIPAHPKPASDPGSTPGRAAATSAVGHASAEHAAMHFHPPRMR